MTIIFPINVRIRSVSACLLGLAAATLIGGRSAQGQPVGAGSTERGGGPTPGTSESRGKATYLPPWNFMSLSTSGVDSFLLAHPTYDGRGVMLLIFDTGVDMSIPGLGETSTGEPKVIDAIDFSASCVVECDPVNGSGNGSGNGEDATTLPFTPADITSLDPPPVDGNLYVGYIDESIYRASSVRDFDGDGESLSAFAVLLYRSANGWRVAVDTDADSSMKGERSVGSYVERQETILFKQHDAERKAPLTFAASIDSAAHTVSFHYDMGGHGTHVAGITAGFGVSGESGFNGIAPGVRLISCKFSGDTAKDNTVTGSMLRAYEYAARLADSLQPLNIPVVVNMSFGIGSAYEGRADMERYIDDIIAEHPNLYVITSAGNEGSGLSTVGIPAAASRVISVGALLPRGIGRDSYGAAIDRDIIWDFSSRGGEVDKPDVLAPGTAISTVPRFEGEARASGTSMASPYTAGVVSLLLSAMRQEEPGWVPTQGLLRRCLRESARPLAGYPSIEQGGGVIDIRRAYDILKRYKKSGFADGFQEYAINTMSPNYPDKGGSTAFWRSAYVPDETWRQSFTIMRAEPPSQTRETEFFRAYTLEPNVPWLKPVQKTVYIRNSGTAEVDVMYDREKMKEPGLYCGKVIARRASAKGKAPSEEVEFELVNTVIVPYLFTPAGNYSITTPSQKLEAGLIRRFYFAVPPGAVEMNFTLSSPKGSKSIVSGAVFDRKGYNVGYLPRIDARERTEGSSRVSTLELGEGVIEVVVQADAFDGAGGVSEFSLAASCTMFEIDTKVERSGAVADLTVEVTGTGTEIVEGTFSHTVKGYGRTVRTVMQGDTFSMPITMYKGDGALWISPKFTPENYMKATDIFVRLLDAEGNTQADEVYNKPQEWLFLPNFNRDADSTVYLLQMVFGSAGYERLPDIPLEIIENHVYPSDSRMLSGQSGSTWIPFIPQTLRGTLPADMPIRAGYHGLGEINYKPRNGNQNAAVVHEYEIPGPDPVSEGSPSDKTF